MLLDLLSILIGLVALFFGGEWLIRASSRLAAALGVPTLIIGLTVVALGTSMPELVVSGSAAIVGSSEIAIGNIVGSTIANLGLVLGLAALIRPLRVHITLIRREIPMMIGASIVVLVMALDGAISQLDGLLLLLGYVIFTLVLVRAAIRQPADAIVTAEVEAVKGQPRAIARGREVGVLLISLIVLILGAQFTVNGATGIARSAGISELVVGLTLVALGTSLPEITTAIMATLRGHHDIATGGAVGSNIANLLVVLGVTAVIRPIAVAPNTLGFDLPVMIAFAVAFLPMAFNQRLARWQGGLLLIGYLAYLVFTFR